MRKPMLYIAGKYRAPTKEGIEENIEKARAVSVRMAVLGYLWHCPHMHTAHYDDDLPEWSLDEWLDLDYRYLDIADGILMMDGWEESEGAKKEHERSKKMGLPISGLWVRMNLLKSSVMWS